MHDQIGEEGVRRIQEASAMQPNGDLHLLPRLGTFAEALPRTEVPRSGAALPAEPLTLRRSPHYGWSAGRVHVRELSLDLAVPAPLSATVADLAARMVLDESGWVAVADEHGFVGVVTARAILRALQRGQLDAPARKLVDRDAPSCAPESTVADAVRLMLERSARKLPVVEHGRCVGVLPLSVAAACEDPEVRGLLEAAVTSPSLFARAWW